MRLIFLLVSIFSLTTLRADDATPVALEKPTLTLYHAPWCYYCNKVTSYLEKIGKTLPMKDVQNPLYKEELVRLGGKRQIPCLFIGNKPLYESSEIIDYLSKHQDLLEPAP